MESGREGCGRVVCDAGLCGTKRGVLKWRVFSRYVLYGTRGLIYGVLAYHGRNEAIFEMALANMIGAPFGKRGRALSLSNE